MGLQAKFPQCTPEEPAPQESKEEQLDIMCMDLLDIMCMDLLDIMCMDLLDIMYVV